MNWKLHPKVLSIKVEEELEILAGSSMRGNIKLDKRLSTKLSTGSDISYCSKTMLNQQEEKFSLSFPYWAFLTMTV